jgi:hypothetical protein
VRFKETNASEPLMKCRNGFYRRRNRGLISVPGQGWGKPGYCPIGVRHVGGVTLNQALVRNVGTCRPDVKEKPKQTDSARGSVPMRGTGTESLVVGLKAL